MIQKPNFYQTRTVTSDKNSVMEIFFFNFFVSAYANFEGGRLEKSIGSVGAQARMA